MAQKKHSQSFKGTCHCSKIQFELLITPQWLVSCNCSICTKIGGVWAHAETSEVKLKYDPGETIAYAWGDKTLAFHSCKTCGCTTHWENLQPDKYSHMGVNFRMCQSADIEKFMVRKFDGADTWEYLDN